jgi:hypothetical protein
MDLALSREFAHVPGLWDRLRNLQWFRASFEQGADLLARRIDAEIEVDGDRSSLACLSWSEKLALQKDFSIHDGQAYGRFACGLLLADLFRTAPLRVTRAPRSSERSGLPAETWAIAEFWCEGFILTSFCTSLLDGILQQEFQRSATLAPVASEMRTWWSFRENVQEEPARAIGFFDLLLGNEPHWQILESYPSRIGNRRGA